MNSNINLLIQSSWTKLSKCNSFPKVVNPSVPILWFGDMKAYEKSELRIVTVGLNPSCWEFKEKENGPFEIKIRFPKAASLFGKKTLTTTDVYFYSDAMNEYFKHRPYSKWFQLNERVLNELSASYNAEAPGRLISENHGRTFKHTAIHIDIYSPLASDPAWDGLKTEEKEAIRTVSYGIYDDLINILDPDIFVVAVNRIEVARHFINSKGQKCTKFNADFSSTNTPNDYLRGFTLNDGKKLIWGTNYHGQPFSSVKQLPARMASLRQRLSL